MKTNLKKLEEIIEENRKYYKGDPLWQAVATYYIEQTKELRDLERAWKKFLGNGAMVSVESMLGE